MKTKRRKRSVVGSVEKDILEDLSGGDVLMSFLLSGGSTRALYREAAKRAQARYRAKRSIASMEKRGLVAKRGDLVGLTEKGMDLLKIVESRKSHAAGEWKGHWWLVLYDIPVSASPFRFELRRVLIRGGFRKLQHSVWVHPHKSKELEIFLKNTPGVRRYALYIEVLPFVGLETIADWKKLSAG